MNPTRKRRLWILLAIVLAAGLATEGFKPFAAIY